MKPRPVVIGLAGGTGAGKSTVSDAIVQAAGGHAAILPHDAYYRAQPGRPFEARARTNYDEPGAFETEALVRHLDALLEGRGVDRPVYDFGRHDRSGATVRVDARPVVVVEGILVLHEASLRERMTLKVFVDAPPDERFIRRLERDVHERGRDADGVIAQYRQTVKPMHDLYVEPTKQYADLIVPEGGRNEIAMAVLASFVETSIRAGTDAKDASAEGPQRA